MKKEGMGTFDIAENTAKQQRGKPFQPGQSGNPAGRPKGSLNRTTLATQTLLGGELESITRKVVEMAKEGDIAAIKIILEHLLPPHKGRLVYFELPEIHKPADILEAQKAVVQAVANGSLTPCLLYTSDAADGFLV